jgi:2-iminobutanoate/2-iminopropanoate deaminase
LTAGPALHRLNLSKGSSARLFGRINLSKIAITSPELTPPVGPFSQAIEVDGFVYLNGQVGQDPATGELVPGRIVAETEQVFSNAAAVLRAASLGFDDVISVRVFLTRIENYQSVNAIYAQHFSEPFPARTAVAVAALPWDVRASLKRSRASKPAGSHPSASPAQSPTGETETPV